MLKLSKKLEQYLRKERILTQFKANLRSVPLFEDIEEWEHTISSIRRSFQWSRSQQGFYFWRDHHIAFYDSIRSSKSPLQDNTRNHLKAIGYSVESIECYMVQRDAYVLVEGFIMTQICLADLIEYKIDLTEFFTELELLFDREKHGIIVSCLDGEGDIIFNELFEKFIKI